MNQIELVVGDWSQDGHNMTESIIIVTNLSVEEVKQAYQKGCSIIGFDFSNTVCVEYEESFISEEKVEILDKYGVIKKETLYDKYNNNYTLTPAYFALIYLQICQLGNNNFNFELVNNRSLNIGGYGLFW